MIKWSVHQTYIIILSVHAPSSSAAKYVKHKWIEMKGKIDKSTIIVGDFNISFSTIESTPRQKTIQIQKT